MITSTNNNSVQIGIESLHKKITPRTVAIFPSFETPKDVFEAEMRQLEKDKLDEANFDPSLADNAPSKAVKTVVLNGKIVATIYESGITTIHDGFIGLLKDVVLPNQSSSGRRLGMQRAEIIAMAVGGEIKDVSKDERNNCIKKTPNISHHQRFSIK